MASVTPIDWNDIAVKQTLTKPHKPDSWRVSVYKKFPVRRYSRIISTFTPDFQVMNNPLTPPTLLHFDTPQRRQTLWFSVKTFNGMIPLWPLVDNFWKLNDCLFEIILGLYSVPTPKSIWYQTWYQRCFFIIASDITLLPWTLCQKTSIHTLLKYSRFADTFNL